MWTAGLDWAYESHTLCVVDSRGEKVDTIEVRHTARGLAEMCRWLAKVAPAEKPPVAIERPSGLIVDTLIKAGYLVIPIHPNVLKASRSRYRAAGSKSDAADAYILADLLRTDGHRFRPLSPHSDEIRALRALVRTRGDLVAQRIALTNQLRSVLHDFWPGPAGLFSSLSSLISLAFLEKYPTPSHAKALGVKRMAAFLQRQGYSGCRTPEALLERLRASPKGHAGEIEEQARGELVHALVAVIKTVVERIRTLTKDIEQLIIRLPRGRVLMSFPRVGKLNAAQILAELGEDPARFPSETQLAAEAGVTPVTRVSGKYRNVAFRFACNKHLRCALTCFADNSRHSSPWAASRYAEARGRGRDHPHAVRILARAWVRVLWKAWKDGVPYDPAKHGGALKRAA